MSGRGDASSRAVSFGHDSGGLSRRPGFCPTAIRRRRRRPQPPLTRGSVYSILLCLFRAETDRTRPGCIRHPTTRRYLEPITGRLGMRQLIVLQVTCAFFARVSGSARRYDREPNHALFVNCATHLPWPNCSARSAARPSPCAKDDVQVGVLARPVARGPRRKVSTGSSAITG